MLCAHFSLCSVQFVARYSLRSSRALRARWARFAGPLRGVLIVQCIIPEGGDPPPLKRGEMARAAEDVDWNNFLVCGGCWLLLGVAGVAVGFAMFWR